MKLLASCFLWAKLTYAFYIFTLFPIGRTFHQRCKTRPVTQRLQRQQKRIFLLIPTRLQWQSEPSAFCQQLTPMGTAWPGLLAVCRGTLQPCGMDPRGCTTSITIALFSSCPALPKAQCWHTSSLGWAVSCCLPNSMCLISGGLS